MLSVGEDVEAERASTTTDILVVGLGKGRDGFRTRTPWWVWTRCPATGG